MKTFAIGKARRFETILALGLTTLLVSLHLALLWNRGPLWRDEISSLTAATAPTLSQFWAALSLDPMPALFLLLLRYWKMLVGESDFGLRILGCLIGLSCIAAFWLNARLTGRRTPIITLLLLGFSPTLVIWGDSLRGYGLGVVGIVLTFSFFWKLLERPNAWTFVAATLAAILSVQSIYANAWLVLACGLAAACVAIRRKHWTTAVLILLAGALAALSLLPYLTLFRTTTEWASFSQVDYSLANSCRVLSLALLSPIHFLFWIWLALIAVAIPAALWTQFSGASGTCSADTRDLTLYALLAAVAGFIGTMWFFWFVGWGTNVWYYLPMLAIAALAIDAIVDCDAFSHRTPTVRVALAFVGAALSLPVALQAGDVRATNLDLVSQIVSQHAGTEDLVVVWPLPDGITFKRYLPRALVWVTVPEVANLPGKPGDDFLLPYRRAEGIQPILDRVNQALKSNHRVWLVSTWPLMPSDGPSPKIPPLQQSDPRGLFDFSRGWGTMLADELRAHATEMRMIRLPNDQPVSSYEASTLLMFSGWKEISAVAQMPTSTAGSGKIIFPPR